MADEARSSTDRTAAGDTIAGDIATGRQVIEMEARALSALAASLDQNFVAAVDILLKAKGRVILTGMGRDGAQGLLTMRKAGAKTLGQDEASCVVYGMPRSAFEIGAVERQVSLSSMGQSILDLASARR